MREVDVMIDSGVAVVTIDRPHARNAIGLQTISELGEALDRVTSDGAAVVVLRGAGDRAFVSGGDLKELGAIRDEEGAIDMATRMRRLLDRLATLPIPVIAALNGHALGGGAEVAVAADIRVAADDVKIGFTQVQLAIMPAWGGTERLAEVVGRSTALLLICTGKTLTVTEAERIGLFDVVFPRDEFEAGWNRLASQFAALGREATRSIKATIAAAKPQHHPLLERDAVRAFARLWLSEEHWQAVKRLGGNRC
jgi:enoyl-CoA hydratase